MRRNFLCPAGHTWHAEFDTAADAMTSSRCPDCGAPGQLLASDVGDQETAVREAETLSPAVIPPWIQPLTTLVPSRDKIIHAEIPTPKAIGNYEIVRELARGGMGVVYQARRPDLDRFVAIKMMLAGEFANEEAIRRLRTEAEAVAKLQHANIVQIHDVGEHNGQPFLVLEYIEGGSLARRIAGKPLPPRLAAQLILTISRAIEFAHSQGILHRDLTPSNVLVSATGATTSSSLSDDNSNIDLANTTLKITDFGLAKRLNDDLGHTRTGMIMGTPSYMAPEQASGNAKDVGPSCDIYALGSMLYELLTGRPPFAGATAMETLEQVVRQEPVPPKRLQPRLPLDLETICLKCLEKAPSQRYDTAGALADDLNRFLQGEPILARRVSPVGRAVRWSRRRPTAAALILVSVLAVVVGAVGSYWSGVLVRNERDRAEENLRMALKAVDSMLSEVGEQDFAYEPRLDEKRRVLLHEALTLYQAFLARQADDTRLQFETAQAFRRMGDIERWLGNFKNAETAYTEAIQLFDALHAQEPGSPDYRRWLAYCHNYLGEAYRQSSQPQPAEASYGRALALDRELHQAFPETVEYAQDLARAQYNTGILLGEMNRHADAEKVLTQAIDLLGKLSSMHSNKPELRQELARVHLNLGAVYRATSRTEEALEHAASAIALLGELVVQDPQRPDYRFELAIARANRGNIHARQPDGDRGREDYEQSIQLLTKLVADFPTAPSFRQELANTSNGLAALDWSTGNKAGALNTWAQTVTQLRDLVAQHPSVPTYRADLGLSLGNLGWALNGEGQFDQASKMLDEGIVLLKDALRANPEHTYYAISLRNQLRDRGRAAIELHDHVAAAAAARELSALSTTSGNDRLAAACVLARAAGVVEADSHGTAPEQGELVQQYYDEAASWIRAAAVAGVSDAAVLAESRTTLQAAMGKHKGLSEACELLFPPDTSAPVSANP